MHQTSLATGFKTVRLPYATAFIVLLVVVYLTAIRPWMATWGSTTAERQMGLPGDTVSADHAGTVNRAVTIHAPAAEVWAWLAQVGQDRAGFYSYTWLENLIGSDIHNADEIHPEWQQLAAGDSWRLAPPGYLWGLGQGAVMPVLASAPGRALVIGGWGAWVLVPVDAQTTRLIVRGQSSPGSPVTRLMTTMLWEPVVFTMERRMLLGIQARAEGRVETHAALLLLAQAGWVAAGVTVMALFLRVRHHRFWLALPLAAALPGLLMSRDPQAGLAAFLALGIVLLGFLHFGRRWWGTLLVVTALVLLTLLLAPDAYLAFGLTFVLLLMVAGGVMLTSRAGSLGGAGHRVAGARRTG